MSTSAPLAAEGLDSLAAVELRNILQDRMGIKVSATLLFDHPTITEVANHLMVRSDCGEMS